MNYPKRIPAGTLIRLGKKPGTVQTSHGMLVKLMQDAVHIKHSEEGRYDYSFNSDVIENPNGWHSEQVTHRINLQYDIIVQSSNKATKYVLERLED